VVKTAVYIDDDVRLNYPRGFVLNGTLLAEQAPYPKSKEVNYLLGARYAPLRKEFWDVPAKPIRVNLETVMITFGGADIRNVTPKVLKLLTDAYPEVLKKVIIAKSFRNIAEIERLKDDNTKLIYYPNAAEMKKVMLESDIAISAGGQTLYELARIGVPTIGICIAENQLQNIEGWRKSGFLKYVGWYSDENLEQRLKSSLRYLANKRIRMHTSEIGRKVIDGQGYKRIINAINTK
jgi:spore coat polysaccharide biosynthesis predicted glycosyltransferase SpsG